MKANLVRRCGLGPLLCLSAFSCLQAEDFQAQSLARLFTVPQGRVLESMEVLLSLGGAYGSMNKGEYLGRASVGLGDFAELEISTWRLVSNLVNGSTALGTTALTVGLIRQQPGTALPDLALSFRLNPSWKDVEVSGSDLADEIEDEVDEVKFQAHFASLYMNLSKNITAELKLHGGIFLTDMRTRSGSALVTGGGLVTIPDERQDLIGGFGGIEHQLNPRTYLIAEISSVPRFNYAPSSSTLAIDQVAMFIGGVRFFFDRRISMDAGVKYRSDYGGIADSEIAVGLNIGFNVADAFHKIANR